MFASRSLRLRASMVVVFAVAVLCTVGAVLLAGSRTTRDVSTPCLGMSPPSTLAAHHKAPAWTPSQEVGGGVGNGARVQTGRRATLADARALARLDQVSVAVELSRIRQQARLDAVTRLLKTRYPDSYAGTYIAQGHYRTTIRFCGQVPAGARLIVHAHQVSAVFDDTAVGSEIALNRAADRVTDALTKFGVAANIAGNTKTDTIEVTIGDGGNARTLTEAERADVAEAVQAAADGFGVRLSYVRGPIDIAQ
jgi:hypothetical protein